MHKVNGHTSVIFVANDLDSRINLIPIAGFTQVPDLSNFNSIKTSGILLRCIAHGNLCLRCLNSERGKEETAWHKISAHTKWA